MVHGSVAQTDRLPVKKNTPTHRGPNRKGKAAVERESFRAGTRQAARIARGVLARMRAGRTHQSRRDYEGAMLNLAVAVQNLEESAERITRLGRAAG